ncbi:MAG TPA: DNA alkylation repair protein [Terriglobia bacterium]|nr:DNA alkylation repair protein [Terriglobia bacterium]
MPTVESILADLKKKGTEKTRKIYARHGMATDNMFGVSVADLKVIAKKMKGQQALACELYATGNLDAMYLAGMVADGSKMTTQELNDWAEGTANLQMISEYTVPWVTVENSHARDLAMQWIKSKKEHVACCGWCAYSGLVATQPDEILDLKEIEGLLSTVVKGIHGAQNRVRYTMNGFIIAVGTYVKPLLKQAKAAARQMGAVSVDVGDTACTVRLASEQIEKMEASGRVGQKRKTIRC